MSATPPVPYDEFGLFHENIAEHGLHRAADPVVRRVDVPVADDRVVSALVWGNGEPRLALIHGGAQNAHTWDTVALALDVPLVAIDLPGHGHSSWRGDHEYAPAALAHDVAVAVERLAGRAHAVVGMSLGGLTAICLAATRPDLVRRLAIVDVTPGVTARKADAISRFINGPQSFADFDTLLARTVEHNPTRAVSSLRRGILHNAVQLDDGTWRWRYDRLDGMRDDDRPDAPRVDAEALWAAVSAVSCPMMLVRGSLSRVVDDDDVAEMRRRQPDLEYHLVDGAGHSVQGDRPVELAELLRRFALG